MSKYTENKALLGLLPVTTTIDRDIVGRITKETTGLNVESYSYNAAGAVTKAKSLLDAQTFTYDSVGDRTTSTTDGVKTTYSYDDADELTSMQTGLTTATRSYDKAGRLLTQTGLLGAGTSINYDSFGRASSWTNLGLLADLGLGQSTGTFSYTPSGLLGKVTNTASGVTRTQQFAWSTGSTPQILTEKGTAPADFVYGEGRISADTSATGNPFSYDADGNTIATTGTAAWAQAGGYDTFGEPGLIGGVVNTLSPDFAFGYRGELAMGATIYLRARLYDSSTGTFTSEDPEDGVAGMTAVTNPYPYANLDPVNETDPTGQAVANDLNFQPTYRQSGPCANPPGSIRRQLKSFGPDNVVLCTRGYLSQECLDGVTSCLSTYWYSRRSEAAAQSFTIRELNYQREGAWHRYLDKIGSGTSVSPDVDWEVGPIDGTMRIDIMTEEKRIYEVRNVASSRDPAVTLAGYQSQLLLLGVPTSLGTQLDGWAGYFTVYGGFFDYLTGGDRVYVWGQGPGIILFARGKRAPEDIRARAKPEKGAGYSSTTGFPAPLPVPVPVPV